MRTGALQTARGPSHVCVAILAFEPRSCVRSAIIGMHSMLTRAYDSRHLKIAGFAMLSFAHIGQHGAEALSLSLKISKSINVRALLSSRAWRRAAVCARARPAPPPSLVPCCLAGREAGDNRHAAPQGPAALRRQRAGLPPDADV